LYNDDSEYAAEVRGNVKEANYRKDESQ